MTKPEGEGKVPIGGAEVTLSSELSQLSQELSGDIIGLSRTRHSGEGAARPHLLALSDAEGAEVIERCLRGTALGEGFVFRSLRSAEGLEDALKTVPAVAVLVDRAARLPVVHQLKQSERFGDVPVLYLLGTGADPDSPRRFGVVDEEEMARRALRAGCDDVLLGALEEGALVDSLGAIWTWYQANGFAPPSGHSFFFSKRAQRKARKPTEQDPITLFGTHQFSPGEEGSAHVLLVSGQEPFLGVGQQILKNIGCHVSYVDSAFLGLQFLQRLAAQAEPSVPGALQGKLDLVIVALEGGISNAMPLVRHLKSSANFAQVPLLLLTTTAQGAAQLQPYHQKGVYLDIDPEPRPEELIFRIHEVFQARGETPRVQRRYLCANACAWRLADVPNAPWRQAMTYNLSPQGVYVRTLSPPRRGQRVELRFRLQAHSFLLEFSGPVVWSNPWSPSSRRAWPQGFGLWLKEGSQSHFEALADHCDFLRESLLKPRARKGEPEGEPPSLEGG